MTVVVLTEPVDPTADLVVAELNSRGVAVFRCDAADFPQRLTVTAEYGNGPVSGVLESPERTVALAEVSAVYYRRPLDFVFAVGMSATERWWAAGEARMGFGGVLQSLGCRWLSDPVAVARAEYKPVQLAAARRVGLAVPDTMVTNDPAAARKFVAACPDGAVYKALTGSPGSEAGRPVALYTSVVEADQVDDAVARTAHLFQRRIAAKKFEARVTVVGDRVFAARIDAHSDAARIDFRADYDAVEFSRLELPPAIRDGVLALTRTLGLAYGALDFIIDDADRYWYLETNPNGQWAFIPHLRAPITRAIADYLQGGVM
jgi:ATP-grasp ribosomal peptide maturase